MQKTKGYEIHAAPVDELLEHGTKRKTKSLNK